jgi:hypothetical protein
MDARSPQIVRAVKAADLLLDRDPWGASWIAAHRAQQAAAAAVGAAAGSGASAGSVAGAGSGAGAAAGAGARPAP